MTTVFQLPFRTPIIIDKDGFRVLDTDLLLKIVTEFVPISMDLEENGVRVLSVLISKTAPNTAELPPEEQRFTTLGVEPPTTSLIHMEKIGIIVDRPYGREELCKMLKLHVGYGVKFNLALPDFVMTELDKIPDFKHDTKKIVQYIIRRAMRVYKITFDKPDQ